MRLKVRPDLHHAPLADGVYVSSATGEFALSGWPGFADLMTRCLPLLGAGTDEDDLVEAIGTEKARPAIRHLLGQLDAHDMVLHLDALDLGAPTAGSQRHAELLAYLECRSTQPYTALERVRSARIMLHGPDGAIQTADDALHELGLDRAPSDGRPHDVAVVVMEPDRVEPIPPQATSFLPVVVASHAALVGPMVHDLRGWNRWRTLTTRVLSRTATAFDRDAATAVSASTAVHLLLQDLASVAGPDAYVVSGDTIDVEALDFPPEPPDAHEVNPTTATDQDHETDLAPWLLRLTHPWLGVATSLEEESLPQMPVALRRFQTVDDSRILAEGVDQGDAADAAVLGLTREITGSEAAGTSQVRWLLDGTLRHLTQRVGPGSPFTVSSRNNTRLVRSLPDRAGRLQLTAHKVSGIGWVLVRCVLADGRTTMAWGPDQETAAADALSRAVAAHHVPLDGPALLGALGTAALRSASTDDITTLMAQVQTWAATRSLRIVGRPHPADPHLGPSPVYAGEVSLSDETTSGTTAPSTATLTDLVDALATSTGAEVVTTRGWEYDPLHAAVQSSEASGQALIPLQLGVDAVVAGPVWSPGTRAACPACAETRRRTVLDHVLGTDLQQTATPAGPTPASLIALASTVIRSSRPVRPGQVMVVSTDGITRHEVLRHPTCPWCRPAPNSIPSTGLDLADAPVDSKDPTRVANGTPLLRSESLEERVDDRYGPVRGILREENVPYAMSMAVLAGAPVMGHGRALRFDQTRSVAVLEAYERLAGFPYEAPLVMDRPYREVANQAIDPLRLGQYSASQLAHPSSKVEAYHPDLPIDWAWGVELAQGRERLVPAEIGFYQYDHTFKRDIRASRAATPQQRRRIFLESSSGCALGSTLAEATIHALLEVAERDAFLLSWHRAAPLPRIPAAELADPVIEALVALVESRGFQVHFLRATQDIDLPVIWVLAVSEDGTFPATFTSAGSGADPVAAARSALREVAQLATMPLDWDREDARFLVEDSWRVRDLEDHVRWSSAPEALERVTAVLGGPQVGVEEAFPGWPDALRPHSGGIRETLDLITARFAAAGLDEIVAVDQSTCEHRDLGIHVVKAVVPGAIPMVFGQAHQRLTGIARFEAAMQDRPTGVHPFDPHPFP